MVFKRRDPRGWWQAAREYVYPRGGFRRAIKYVLHRMRRLPDPPHRIARGVFIGTFVNFPPLYGLQLLTAAALSWLTRGNILAAMEVIGVQKTELLRQMPWLRNEAE